MTRGAFLGSAAAALAADAYSAGEQAWRNRREAALKAPGGWLTVTGLHWLEEGGAPVEPSPGYSFELRGGRVLLSREGKETEVRTDKNPPPESILTGTLAMTAIVRGPRTGIRVRDSQSRLLREFSGLLWYSVDRRWRVEARWIRHPSPQKREIDSVGGIRQQLTSLGVAEFRLDGRDLRLDALEDPDGLFFVFKDETARTDTYPGGRFLYAPPPSGGRVTLDFNRAENPPCAFTPYATCPLAPRGNWLPAAVPAGEKRYH